MARRRLCRVPKPEASRAGRQFWRVVQNRSLQSSLPLFIRLRRSLRSRYLGSRLLASNRSTEHFRSAAGGDFAPLPNLFRRDVPL